MNFQRMITHRLYFEKAVKYVENRDRETVDDD